VAPNGTERGRDLAIDMAKGCAILWVLLIHSEALRGNLLFRHVVNQAVPVFVVLFGLNSSLWWRHRDLRDLGAWYRRGIRRLMVPVWGALVVWWALALYYRPFGVSLTWWLPFVQAFGYLLHVGTGWFVTMILQLVIVFPAFEWLRVRIGLGAVLALGVAASAGFTWYGLQMLGLLSLFNFYVFSPRFWGHMTFGMLLAHHRDRLTPAAGVLAAAVVGGGVAAGVAGIGYPWAHEIAWVCALALTVVLLVGLRPLVAVPVLAPTLAWLGQSSYGIYIGQLLTHNFFVYRLGIPGLLDGMNRWLYTAVLLVGGLFFVWVGEILLRYVPLLAPATVPARKALDTPQGDGGS
jgi:peptidoglycan/LPS O-acetylase OafA/YrhL